MKIIILDTDFLISCIKFKVDFVEEIKRICDFNYKLFIFDKGLEELENKPNHKLIKLILQKNNVEIIKKKFDKKVDDLILDIVNDNYIIATQDKELKKELKKKDIKIITIRKKKYLVLL